MQSTSTPGLPAHLFSTLSTSSNSLSMDLFKSSTHQTIQRALTIWRKTIVSPKTSIFSGSLTHFLTTEMGTHCNTQCTGRFVNSCSHFLHVTEVAIAEHFQQNQASMISAILFKAKWCVCHVHANMPKTCRKMSSTNCYMIYAKAIKLSTMSDWVRSIVPHQQIIGYCGDESFQLITYDGSDNQTQNNQETMHRKHKITQNTNWLWPKKHKQNWKEMG